MSTTTLNPIVGVIRVKDGVQFTRIAPGGFRLLEALNLAASILGIDLTITSACDGEHSGPDDPHHRGEAFDVRSHDLDPLIKARVLDTLAEQLPPGRFFCFLESPGTDNEHFHLQVRKGTTYP